MPQSLSEAQWDNLLRKIRAGKCTPFLGAGVNYGLLPLGGELARTLAEGCSYPFDDCRDLLRVTEFMAVDAQEREYPKAKVIELLRERLQQCEESGELHEYLTLPENPSGETPAPPLAVLADLPLPIYMTTNYDDLLLQALKARGKSPKREVCRWDPDLPPAASAFNAAVYYEPSEDEPVVFHLHGYDEDVASLVLTEDDYIDFVINTSKGDSVLPPLIQQAMSESTLLFIGYALRDWDFRVIYRSLVLSVAPSRQRFKVTVQLDPDNDQRKRYLTNYYQEERLQVYWGTASTFAAELHRHWRAFTDGGEARQE